MTDRQWLNKSFKAFEVAPPFQLRFLQVCLDKCAFAHLQLSTIHVSFKRFKKAEFSADSKDAGLNRHWLANLLIHELGHLLGLYHSFEFTNDPVAIEAKAAKIPNFMSHDIAFKSTLGFVDFQKRLIHSYLGGGRVFQQYQAGRLRRPEVPGTGEALQRLPGAAPHQDRQGRQDLLPGEVR